MRIGFDVSQTGAGKAGCGFFADGLIRELAAQDRVNEYVLYPSFGDFFFDPSMPRECPLEQPNFRYGLRQENAVAARAFWQNPPGDLEARLGEPDIVHANNFFCPPGLRRAKLVYTLYDLNFLEHPEWTTETNRVGCFEGVFNASLHADLVIAISDHSRMHFLETFPHFPENRIAVVHPASRFASRGEATRPASLAGLEPQRFWLTVGTIEPRKNHLRLLEAYASLKRGQTGVLPLAIAGGTGWLMESFPDAVRKLGLERDVRLLGYVDDAALRWLYQNCYATVYPSLFEGFGLPVLEAMALGAAVIASNATSIPEIAGDAAVLVEPTDPGAICEAMARLASDPGLAERLRSRAPGQATGFSWKRAAQEVLRLYAEVAAAPKRDIER